MSGAKGTTRQATQRGVGQRRAQGQRQRLVPWPLLSGLPEAQHLQAPPRQEGWCHLLPGPVQSEVLSSADSGLPGSPKTLIDTLVGTPAINQQVAVDQRDDQRVKQVI